jgi:hypothetical protein
MATSQEFTETARLQQIARASVQLAGLVPTMAAVAASLQTQAGEQAESASRASASASALAAELEAAVRELGATSQQMAAALLTVRRIADHTRILSVNASIEAARAGVMGRAFGVVVDEVQKLADTTGTTTSQIESEVERMNDRVQRVSALARDEASGGSTTIGAVTQGLAAMAGSARRQLESAHSIHGMGGRVESLAESLLLSVGTFRFEAHARARRAVEALLPILSKALLQPAAVDAALSAFLAEHGYFELAYATDASGRQFVNNLSWDGQRVQADRSAIGRSWSQRAWFTQALASEAVVAGDLYRSAATKDFCFTVSACWRDRSGRPAGVVAADVNFHRLVGEAAAGTARAEATRPRALA